MWCVCRKHKPSRIDDVFASFCDIFCRVFSRPEGRFERGFRSSRFFSSAENRHDESWFLFYPPWQTADYTEAGLKKQYRRQKNSQTLATAFHKKVHNFNELSKLHLYFDLSPLQWIQTIAPCRSKQSKILGNRDLDLSPPNYRRSFINHGTKKQWQISNRVLSP